MLLNIFENNLRCRTKFKTIFLWRFDSKLDFFKKSSLLLSEWLLNCPGSGAYPEIFWGEFEFFCIDEKFQGGFWDFFSKNHSKLNCMTPLPLNTPLFWIPVSNLFNFKLKLLILTSFLVFFLNIACGRVDGQKKSSHIV